MAGGSQELVVVEAQQVDWVQSREVHWDDEVAASNRRARRPPYNQLVFEFTRFQQPLRVRVVSLTNNVHASRRLFGDDVRG